MKKVIAVFALVFVAGILAGGAYEWLSGRSAENAGTDRSSAAAEEPEPVATSSEGGEVETVDETTTAGENHSVTNPNKICSTPGCGRAVFVTYKGKELCVKCYGEAKKWDSEHE